jgi:uncharacterized protein with NRDE domain
MCTLVLLRRPGHQWPLLLGANRDEMLDRTWTPPGRHWPDRPEVTAGRDDLAGGSWLGVNDHGVAAAILNRTGSLGPLAGKRSRGELVLDALDYGDAVDAATALSGLDAEAYRPFNLVVADDRDAFWLAHRGRGRVAVTPIPEGLSMLTARELDDETSPRIRRYRPRFNAAAAPDPEKGDWQAWQQLLGESEAEAGLGPESAMRFAIDAGAARFGTMSSSLIAIPPAGIGKHPIWLFARVDAESPATAPHWAPVEGLE